MSRKVPISAYAKQKRKEISEGVSRVLGVEVEFGDGVPVHKNFIQTSKQHKQLILSQISTNPNPLLLSQLLFELGGERGRKTSQPSDLEYSRAWFIVTTFQLNEVLLNLPIKSGLRFIYGGKCHQIINHYHYLIITNHKFSQLSMKACNPSFVKIEKMSVNTSACLKYISLQLVGRPVIGGKFVYMKGIKEYKSDRVKRRNERLKVGKSKWVRSVFRSEDIFECDGVEYMEGYSGEPAIVFRDMSVWREEIVDIVEEKFGDSVWVIGV